MSSSEIKNVENKIRILKEDLKDLNSLLASSKEEKKEEILEEIKEVQRLISFFTQKLVDLEDEMTF